MGTTVCNKTSLGTQLNKVDKSLLNQRFFKRTYLGSKTSSCCYTRNSLRKACIIRLKSKRSSHNSWAFVSDQEDHSDTINGEDGEEDVPKTTLIWRAIKLPIYSVALVPVLVGSAAAFFHTGLFSAGHCFLLFISSVFIVAWLNLSNDVYDFDTGADENKKESVVNLTGCRTGTLVAANSLLALSLMILAWMSIQAGSIRTMLLVTCMVAFGYVYQYPPFRLSYQGLGEPLCFAASGPFATSAYYLIQSSTSHPITSTILSSSLLVGFTTALILFCSHFHQIEGDLAVRKMSPLVRIGTERGAKVVKFAIIALYILVFALGLTSVLPLACVLLCALTLPMAKLVVSFVGENHKDKKKIFMAKYYCVRLHTLFGAALAVGLVLARIFPIRYVTK